MAIILDATSHNSGNSITSLTISHTNAGNLLVVGIQAGASDIVTGVTYAGSSMTRINEVNNGNSTSYLYYILGPAGGVNNIVITTNISATISGDAASFKNVKQSTPDATVTNTASATNAVTNTLTTIADNSIHLAAYTVDTNPVTSITNGTLINSVLGYSNALLITPAGSHTMTGNSSGGNNAWATCGAAFGPSSGTGGLLSFEI